MEDSNELWTKALLDLQIAINSIPANEKPDYLRAIDECPHLVATESDPRKYLRHTNFDMEASAKTIVAYWKLRCKLFGEKAFLPLALVKDETKTALSRKAIQGIRTATGALLPPDSKGNPFFLHDATRRLNLDTINRHQMAFFNYHVLAESTVAQTNGVNFVVLMSEFHYDALYRKQLNEMTSVMPIKWNTWHIINCVPKWQQQGIFERLLLNPFMRLYGDYLAPIDKHFYSDQDKGALLLELQSNGLDLCQIPRHLGGTWSYEQAGTWFRNRVQADTARWEEASSIHHHDSFKTDQECPVPDYPVSSLDTSQEQDWVAQTRFALKLLPDPEKKVCSKALKEAQSKVLLEEVKEDAFLRAEFNHPWFAARRLARYWTLREETFGCNATLPLDQSGDGALRRSELAVLGSTFLNLLPEDEKGSPVLWIDDSLLETSPSQGKRRAQERRKRCLFYMFQIMAEADKAQTEGCVLLYRVNGSTPFKEIDAGFLDRLGYSLPLRIKAVHILSHKDLPPSVTKMVKCADKVHIHVGASPEALSHRLNAYGMKKDNLPKRLGGHWGFSRFIYWQELRTRMEFGLPLHPHIGDDAKSDPSAYYPFIRPSSKPIADDQQEERARRMNVVHCRRKRDRQRVEIECLQEDRRDLQVDQKKLRTETTKLEGLIQAAKEVVASVHETARGLASPVTRATATVAASIQAPPNVAARSDVAATNTSTTILPPTMQASLEMVYGRLLVQEAHDRNLAALQLQINLREKRLREEESRRMAARIREQEIQRMLARQVALLSPANGISQEQREAERLLVTSRLALLGEAPVVQPSIILQNLTASPRSSLPVAPMNQSQRGETAEERLSRLLILLQNRQQRLELQDLLGSTGTD